MNHVQGLDRTVDLRAAAAAAALVGVILLVPSFGPNIALVDSILSILLILGWLGINNDHTVPARTLLGRAAPWLAVVAVATLATLYGNGYADWALRHTLQDTYAYALFFGIYHVFWERRERADLFVRSLVAAILLVAISLTLTGDTINRPDGTFYHPNYAGHFLVSATLVCLYWLRRWWQRLAVLAVAAYGVFLTASFGAFVMLIAVLVYLIARATRQRPWLAALLLAVLLLGLDYGSDHVEEIEIPDFVVTDTLSSKRLDRSSKGRFELWGRALSNLSSRPLGVGPDGLRRIGVRTDFKESHNTYVAYLAERGPFGFLGLIGLGVVLWRHAGTRGITRPLIVAFAAGNMVRETLHYRHMWLCLALAYVLDELRATEHEEEGSLGEGIIVP